MSPVQMVFAAVALVAILAGISMAMARRKKKSTRLGVTTLGSSS